MKYLLGLVATIVLGINLAYAQGIYKLTANIDYDTAHKRVYAALEEQRFYVLDEINIGQSLARFKDRWKDYNENELENLQVMVICNGWFANKVGNADPDMLALCPMRVTLHHKAGVTTVLFAKPSTFAAESKALPILQEAEGDVIKAIESALK